MFRLCLTQVPTSTISQWFFLLVALYAENLNIAFFNPEWDARVREYSLKIHWTNAPKQMYIDVTANNRIGRIG